MIESLQQAELEDLLHLFDLWLYLEVESRRWNHCILIVIRLDLLEVEEEELLDAHDLHEVGSFGLLLQVKVLQALTDEALVDLDVKLDHKAQVLLGQLDALALIYLGGREAVVVRTASRDRAISLVELAMDDMSVVADRHLQATLVQSVVLNELVFSVKIRE